MKRLDKRSSQQGLLLVEAVLSAIVITVGLVVISRGLGNQLKALRTMDEYDTLLSLAHERLLELEAERLWGPPPTHERADGLFKAPYESYHWLVKATAREDLKDAEGNPIASEVLLTIQRNDRASSSLRLRAVWPSVWIPAEWD